MINIRFFYIIFIFLLGLDLGIAVGQDFQQRKAQIIEKQKITRSEIQNLTEQIQKYEERLELADQKYEALYSKFQDLKNLIALQDRKLKKLRAKQSQIRQEINVTTQALKQKQKKLQQLVTNYKKTLRYLYKHGRTSQLAQILSSSSINQMLTRSFYLKKFSAFRQKQAQQLREAQEELQETKSQLVQAQEKNDTVLSEIKEEKTKLAEQKKQQKRNVELLRENREQIETKLEKTRRQKERLNSTLSKLIQKEEEIRKTQRRRLERLEAERKRKLAAAKEIEDETKRAKEVAKYSEPIEGRNFMDESTLEKVEKQFAQQKGRLPWPVDSRTVSEHFGKRRHPVYGTVTPNPGIEIVTDAQASVHAVHKGYVFAIQPIPGYGDVVLVKHGRFNTAYGNLSRIMVSEGQILQQGDIVGLSGDSYSAKGESLFFLIRENNKNLNPEKWLRSDAVSSTY